jgi:anti-anti-sigma regulatory factor
LLKSSASQKGKAMALRIQSVGACLVVALPPVVDSSHIAEVGTPLHVRVWEWSPQPEMVILDLSPVQFIDSPGVELINETRRQGQERGISVRVVAPTPAQRIILERLGVGPDALYNSLPQALLDTGAGREATENDGGSRRPAGTVDQAPVRLSRAKGQGRRSR